MGFFSSNVGRVSGVAAVVAPVVLALNAAGVWPALDDALFDTFTVFCAPSAREPGAVAVVGIDEPSFAEVGQRWPWPRALHARLVDELSRAGASVIAFDILFSEPLSSGDDVELARAIRDSGRATFIDSVEEIDSSIECRLVKPVGQPTLDSVAVSIKRDGIWRPGAWREFPQACGPSAPSR